VNPVASDDLAPKAGEREIGDLSNEGHVDGRRVVIEPPWRSGPNPILEP
jgi:hypothetical protein